MIDGQTNDRERLVRQMLLVPAVVLVLMTVASPAGAPRVTRPMGIANSAPTAVIAMAPPSPLGRKVG